MQKEKAQECAQFTGTLNGSFRNSGARIDTNSMQVIELIPCNRPSADDTLAPRSPETFLNP